VKYSHSGTRPVCRRREVVATTRGKNHVYGEPRLPLQEGVPTEVSRCCRFACIRKGIRRLLPSSNEFLVYEPLSTSNGSQQMGGWLTNNFTVYQ